MSRSLVYAALASFCLASVLPAQIRDVVYRKNGTSLTGRVLAADESVLKFEVVLMEGQPPAQIAIPRGELQRVMFSTDEKVEEFLKTATSDKLEQVTQLWAGREPFLAIPNSNAGSLGLVLGELLMQSDERANPQTALAIFQKIESQDWSPGRKSLAKCGRLRSMVALGQASEAVIEAKEIVNQTESPVLLIEAKYILGEASFRSFKQLLEENPRWQEDVNVRPERQRLYHETLDLLLFPYLFHGTETEQSARGLWKAVELYQFAGETMNAVEAARDVSTLYPNTKPAAQAREYLSRQPEPKAN